MFDRITDPIGLQTSVGITYDICKNYEFFTIFNFIIAHITNYVEVCNKYCPNFGHEKPSKFIFSV